MGKESGYLEKAKTLYEFKNYQDAFIFAINSLIKVSKGKNAVEAACIALKANYHLGQYDIALRYGWVALERNELENKIFPEFALDIHKYIGLSFFRKGDIKAAYKHFEELTRSELHEVEIEGWRRIALMLAEIEYCQPSLLQPLEGDIVPEDYTRREMFTEPLKCLSAAIDIAETAEEKCLLYTDMGALLLQHIPGNNIQAAIRVFREAYRYAEEENKPITLLRLGLAHACGDTKNGIKKAKRIFKHIVKKHYTGILIAAGILPEHFDLNNPLIPSAYLMSSTRKNKKLMDVLVIWLAAEIEKNRKKEESIKLIDFVLEYFIENGMLFETAQIFRMIFSTWELDSKVVSLFEKVAYMLKARSLKKPGLKFMGRRF